MKNWGQHLSFAARRLRRNPGFTVTVIITLALSIGANTAIFSMVNALMLKSLPYAHPEQMGTIYARVTGRGTSGERAGIDGEKWELLRDNVRTLISGVSGGTSGVNLQAGSHVQYVHKGRISAHYLDVLALQPLLGRNFLQDEDRPHGPKAAILSYGLWGNGFGADPRILGQSILLKGEPYVVVGVLPQSATTPLNADVYTPLQPSREGEGGGTCGDRDATGFFCSALRAHMSRPIPHRSSQFSRPPFFCHSFSRALLRANSCVLQLRVFCFPGSALTQLGSLP
jgi:hypothetical protein